MHPPTVASFIKELSLGGNHVCRSPWRSVGHRTNGKAYYVGVFILAALLLDIALWVLVLLGWESVVIPEDFASTHQPVFVFPYSHGLLSSFGWSVLAAVVLYLFYPRLKGWRLRAAALGGLAVFSHWLLDALVHVRELPLAGVDSTKVGLGLWQDMPVAVAVETAIVVAGLYLFSSLPAAHQHRIFNLKMDIIFLYILLNN